MLLSSNLTGLSGKLRGDGKHEPAFMWLLRNESKGEVALDIGANIGYSTLSLCKNMKKVIAIEPDRRSRKLLKKNLKINNFRDKVDVKKYALSDKIGEKFFYLSRHPNLSAFHRNSKHKTERIKVKTMTIDSLGVIPNFIKMDIEGHEIEVIRGGMESLSKTKFCRILIEVHTSLYSKGHTLSDSIEDLLKIGYNVKYLISAAIPQPDEYKKRGYRPFKVFEMAGLTRGIYKNISNTDAIDLSTKIYNQVIPKTGVVTQKITRAIMLEKNIL